MLDVPGLQGAIDKTNLEWCAKHGRILLSHDKQTIPDDVADLINGGITIAGVVLVSDKMKIGDAIEQLLIIAQASTFGLEEWKNRIERLPWRRPTQ